jgi:hypothetical protein
MTIAEYMNKMWSLGDEMSVSGRPLEEEELVEYVLTGLNHEYGPIVSVVIARTTRCPSVNSTPNSLCLRHGSHLWKHMKEVACQPTQ